MQTAMGQPIRILIIAEQAIVGASLHHLLESKPGLKVVGGTPKSDDAVVVARVAHPDIILFDPGEADGLDLLPELLSAAPQARLLVLTGRRDPEMHRRAMHLGAMGLVTRDRPTEILLQAIAKVHAGEVWLDP
jgi:two-component system, NarL family, nitrate/nitrite response regulator NarL